jgi:hypothetical protein
LHRNCHFCGLCTRLTVRDAVDINGVKNRVE